MEMGAVREKYSENVWKNGEKIYLCNIKMISNTNILKELHYGKDS